MDLLLTLKLFRTLERLRGHDRWTRAQLEAYQAEALRRLRAHAYARSPFYQRFHAGLANRPLHELPVLTKAHIMERFDEVVTDRAVRLADVRAHVASLHSDQRFLDRYWVNATSGSTGQPGLFLFDREEWTMVLASFARAHEWAGLQVSLTHRMKMASVASTDPWHMSAQVGAALTSWWMPTLRLAATEPLETIVTRLNAFQPEMLVAYASMARILADEQLAGRLRIAPHLVFTTSEVLTARTRSRVETAWEHQPFDQYGATEAGDLAAECTHHRGLHVYEDTTIVEVVDAENRPVPPGVYGDKLLITVLGSRTVPLIRYEVSDSVRLAGEPCPCGRPFVLIDAIQGRVEDVLHLPAVGGGEVAVHPLAFHRLLDALPVGGWQVAQQADGSIEVLLSGAADPATDDQVASGMMQALVAQGVVAPRVAVRRVPAIPKSPAGKAPLVRAAGTAAPRLASTLA